MTEVFRTCFLTKRKLQAGAYWTDPNPAVLRDTSCASKKPDWRSRHAAAPRVLPTPPLLTSLRRFVAFLQPIFSVSFLPGWRPQRSSARMCPLIPRGHLAMCPQPAVSLFIDTSYTRFRHDAYTSTKQSRLGYGIRGYDRWCKQGRRGDRNSQGSSPKIKYVSIVDSLG